MRKTISLLLLLRGKVFTVELDESTADEMFTERICVAVKLDTFISLIPLCYLLLAIKACWGNLGNRGDN